MRCQLFKSDISAGCVTRLRQESSAGRRMQGATSSYVGEVALFISFQFLRNWNGKRRLLPLCMVIFNYLGEIFG